MSRQAWGTALVGAAGALLIAAHRVFPEARAAPLIAGFALLLGAGFTGAIRVALAMSLGREVPWRACVALAAITLGLCVAGIAGIPWFRIATTLGSRAAVGVAGWFVLVMSISLVCRVGAREAFSASLVVLIALFDITGLLLVFAGAGVGAP
jgi:hypothetical protein